MGVFVALAGAMSPETMIPWLTGEAYGYGDGEQWPWRFMSPKLFLWIIALKLGLRSRVRARSLGKVIPRHAIAMCGPKRLRNTLELARRVHADNVPGDLIECGVWRGANCILMQAVIKEHGSVKRLYCADTFDGFPVAMARRERVMHPSFLKAGCELVRRNFELFDLWDDSITFIKGDVVSSLKHFNRPLALIRLDVDMYEPTMACLESLYPNLSDGGFIIIDDYGCGAYKARAATDCFRKRNNITTKLNWIDEDGVWWQKCAAAQ